MENRPSRTTFRVRLETMVQSLREGILTGKYAAGSYLPSEEVLGEQFQLSKKSVRKGLEILVEENLIVKKPKIGNMVNSPEDDGDKITIRFAYYPNSDQEINISKRLAEFEKAYPHIRVKPLHINIDHYPSQAIEFMNDQMLDVLMLNYQHFRYFQVNGSCSLLSVQAEDSRCYPFLNRAFTVEGQLYAKPFVFSPVILCYNKAHFREAGLQEPDSSWTWEEFGKAVNQLQKNTPSDKRMGFYFHLISQNRWPLWLLQNGFSLKKDANGRYNLQDEAFLRSITALKELFALQDIVPSFVSENDYDTEKLFLEEKASMILTTYFSLNYLNSVPFEYDISPVPFSGNPHTLLLNIGLAVSQQSNQKEAAQLLVDYLTGKASQEMIRRETLSIPSMKEAAELDCPEHATEPSRFRMFREIIPSFRYYTDMNVESNQLWLMTQQLKLFWSNMDTAENVMQHIELLLNQQQAEQSIE